MTTLQPHELEFILAAAAAGYGEAQEAVRAAATLIKERTQEHLGAREGSEGNGGPRREESPPPQQ